jgi:hypothetical protein
MLDDLAVMRILIHKLSDERHVLALEREGGPGEQAECETRSMLMHDLLHYAVEAEAGLEHGFWGNLAGGRTLGDLNDRSGQAMASALPQLMLIEQIVGALSSIAKGPAPDVLASALHAYAGALGTRMPEWLTAEFITRVRERMRALTGHWKATRFGGTMELAWPESSAPGPRFLGKS